MMEETGILIEEKLPEPPKQEASQPPVVQEPPIAKVNPLKDLTPQMDENAVRAAIAEAEARGIDPLSLKLSEMDSVKKEVDPNVEKFKKTDGEVDVEKLKASTERLNEVVQKKEQAIQEVQKEAVPNKTIEEMLADYKALQKKNSQLPNPQKLAAAVKPAPELPADPNQLTDEQLEQLVNADIQKNPAKVIAEFNRILLERALHPILEERKDNTVKDNLKSLASKDPRVTEPQYWDAIQKELASDPGYWTRKDPHKAAWLEVKDRLQLGEPNKALAQPSKIPSPVLGGGTPPASPSSLGLTRPSIDSLNALDPKDKKQEAMGDEMMRRFFAQQR